MSAKTNKTVNSAFGILDHADHQELEFTDSVTASGVLRPNSLYVFTPTEDCAMYISPYNEGAADEADHPYMPAGVPQIFSTTASTDGGEDADIIVAAKGVTGSGSLFITHLKTRGE